MDRLTAMHVFTEIVDRGSITAAAQSMEMSRAMISRYLESLEDWLGVRILHRTTRRISLTDAGADALLRCRQMLELQSDIHQSAGAWHTEPAGSLRVATSTSLACAQLAGHVTEFLSLHPKVQIELLALERAVNLVEDRIDVAIRITNTPSDTLVARKLGICKSAVCAAPRYLAAHGRPTQAQELRSHRCITHAYVGRNEYVLQRDDETVRIPIHGVFHTNEAVVTHQAALCGAGIALLPHYLVKDDLEQGRLQQLLPDWEPTPLGIYAVYLSRQHQARILRTFLDFLSEKFISL